LFIAHGIVYATGEKMDQFIDLKALLQHKTRDGANQFQVDGNDTRIIQRADFLTYIDASLWYLRRHAEADYYFDQSISVLPDQTMDYALKVWLHWK